MSVTLNPSYAGQPKMHDFGDKIVNILPDNFRVYIFPDTEGEVCVSVQLDWKADIKMSKDNLDPQATANEALEKLRLYLDHLVAESEAA